MIIKQLNPEDETQIRAMSVLERSAFQLSGNDPTEFPEVIKYIGEKGKVFLGCELIKREEIPSDLAEVIQPKEDVVEVPVAFIELVALADSLRFFEENRYHGSFNGSPLMTSKGNADRIYRLARNYAGDQDIVDHHGIGVHKDYQEQGRGSLLLNYELQSDFTRGKVVVCNVDIAKRDGGSIIDIFNDRSFAQHLKRGFVTLDVLEPPVYEETIFYASTVRIPNIKFSGKRRELNIGNIRKNPENLLEAIKDLSSKGFVGVGYDSRRQIMYFDRISTK